MGFIGLVKVEISRFWFVRWSRGWCVTWLYGWGPVVLRHHSDKFAKSPSPHYQCFSQVSETVCRQNLRCFYSVNMLQHWVGGRGLICFCKVDHCRISGKLSRNWLGLNNLCEVLEVPMRRFTNGLTILRAKAALFCKACIA